MQPSKQQPKLLVLFIGSRLPKIMFSILNNQLVCYGVVAVENLSLEDLGGSHFPFLIGIFLPYHTQSISKEE